MQQSWVEVDVRALEHNLRLLQQRLVPGAVLMPVLKSEAYGHGLVAVGRRVRAAGVNWFAVAYLHEALALRPAVGAAHILILGAVEPDDLPLLIRHNLLPIVVCEEHARALDAAAGALGVRLPVHLKLDTGMGRLGFVWSEAEQVLPRVARLPHLELQGLGSHFAAVEPDDPDRAGRQLERFRQARVLLEQQLGRRLFAHISSSRAFLHLPGGQLDGVRIGILLYGYGAGAFAEQLPLQPALQWKTRVVQVKAVPADFPVGYYSTWRTAAPTDLATIALGYADGYLRILSNKGYVLIRGRRCPVVGRVSMNWITVDCGPDSGVRAGDEVVLLGRQGAAEVWADELAGLCGTIAYEILTSIDPRLERRYPGASPGGAGWAGV